ncbi:hypothetical protein [Thalassobacillus sp. CUG 92003]|uniref:hypothetical protein n=1 Tax=Thalassobacillus sp. CUG 92003 TaxID=2736641 RepID=UPI0015E7992A|nr:hypothetical protein [Thalassobacillus sp. CUG 92003]
MLKKSGLLIFLVGFILSGCNWFMSEEDALEKAEENSEKTFKREAIEPNYKSDSFGMYVPETMAVEDESENNIVLSEEEDQNFILFYNAMEEQSSRLNYKTAASAQNEALLLESFETEGRFGYVRVLPMNEEERYELQVGIGGTKMTTFTKKAQLPEDAEKMMEIVNSLAFAS